ncbi:MAG: hypothetical protein M3081_12540 [Gemmatimonadota bacterium]|nr:hypothetical protein [Gemmatimonadota bacterium]
MALTFNRWLAIALVACAAIAYAGRARSASARRFDPLAWLHSGNESRQSASRARLVLEMAVVRARTLARRDSIVPLLHGTAATPEIRYGPGVPAVVRARLEQAVAREWALVDAAPASGVRVAMLVVLDTAPLPRGVERIGYQRVADQTVFLPSATDQRTCLVTFALGPYAVGPGIHPAFDDVLDHVLGPCVFYAAFGHPGPAIDAWLRGRHFDLAYNAAWNRPSIAMHRRPGDVDDSFDGSGQPLDAVACMGGDRARCVAIVADTATRNEFAFLRPTTSPDVIKPSDLWGSDLLLNGQWFLSDIVHEHGREKFARFWTSSLPLTGAFQSAMGESFGDWVHSWTTARYGAMHVGPSPRWLSAAELFALAIALSLATVWLSSRRHVA